MAKGTGKFSLSGFGRRLGRGISSPREIHHPVTRRSRLPVYIESIIRRSCESESLKFIPEEQSVLVDGERLYFSWMREPEHKNPYKGTLIAFRLKDGIKVNVHRWMINSVTSLSLSFVLNEKLSRGI